MEVLIIMLHFKAERIKSNSS